MTDHGTTTSRPGRPPMRTWLLGVAVLFAVRLVGDFVPLMDATGWLWTTRMAELWLVGGLVAVAWRDMPLADMAAGIGRMRLGAVIFLLAATTAGQFVGPGSSAYPFVHWDMYTAGASQVSYGEVWLVDEAEERRRLLLAGSDVTTEPRALSGRLLQEAEAAAAGDDTAIRVLRESIRVLADGAGSAGRAEVLRCVVDEPTAAQPSRCDVVATVALGEP
ncbi:MAG TPA: hypothetical protein VK011_08990 [Acidimicrobiia bacterium]|nr:hypothetical protein [Acidimicrobiia bacterium]